MFLWLLMEEKKLKEKKLKNNETEVSRLEEVMEKYPVEYGDTYLVNGEHLYICADSNTIQLDQADLLLIDPPYLITDIDFDENGWDVESIIQKYKELSRMYLISFGSIELLARIAHIWHMRFSGCWVKPRGVMRSSRAKIPMTSHEFYAIYSHTNKTKDLVFNKVHYDAAPYVKVQKRQQKIRNTNNQIDAINGSRFQDGYVCSNEGKREYTSTLHFPVKGTMKFEERTLHPTQKPIGLLEVLIQWFSNPGDTVLDTFAGSGSTLIAAMRTNRKSIAIEKEPHWVSCGLDRFDRMNIPYEKYRKVG